MVLPGIGDPVLPHPSFFESSFDPLQERIEFVVSTVIFPDFLFRALSAPKLSPVTKSILRFWYLALSF